MVLVGTGTGGVEHTTSLSHSPKNTSPYLSPPHPSLLAEKSNLSSASSVLKFVFVTSLTTTSACQHRHCSGRSQCQLELSWLFFHDGHAMYFRQLGSQPQFLIPHLFPVILYHLYEQSRQFTDAHFRALRLVFKCYNPVFKHNVFWTHPHPFYTFSASYTLFQLSTLVFNVPHSFSFISTHIYLFPFVFIRLYSPSRVFTCLYSFQLILLGFPLIPSPYQLFSYTYMHFRALTRVPPTPIITNTMGPWRTQARDAFASQPFKLGIGKPGMRNVGPIMM